LKKPRDLRMTRLHEHAATPSAHCGHVRMFAAEFIFMQQ
jgi:hypothetical protein